MLLTCAYLPVHIVQIPGCDLQQILDCTGGDGGYREHEHLEQKFF